VKAGVSNGQTLRVIIRLQLGNLVVADMEESEWDEMGKDG